MQAATTTSIATARPQPSHFKPLNELTVSQLLEDPRVMKAMAESAPRHLSPERLLRVMAQAMRKTPKLAQCHPLSLLGAMITCASLGLEPNTPLGHAYLIPFDKRGKLPDGKWGVIGTDINLIIGYQGLIDLARRTGSLVSIHADVVYEGDEFSFEYGSNMHLRHVPTGNGPEDRKPVYAYAHAKLEDGEAFEVLPYSKVLAIRDAAQAYQQAMRQKEDPKNKNNNWATTPWIAYEHEMACKTMVRRLSKWLPKSIEFASAVQLDSMGERGMIDFQAIAAQPALAQDPEGAGTDETQQPEPEKKLPEPPKPKATKAAAQPAKEPDPPPPTEEELREADRMSRAAMEGAEPSHDEETGEVESDEWDDYLAKMVKEHQGAKNPKEAKAIADTFQDTIVGANGRKELSDERAEVIIKAWAEATAPKKAGK